MKIQSILFLFPTLFVITLTAHGATLTSAPIVVGATESIRCVAHNLSDAPVEISAQLKDLLGTTLFSNTNVFNIGEVRVLIGGSAGQSGYCVFQFDGKKKKFRGYAIKQEQPPNAEWELVIEAD
jgi:hypothetical protein